MLCCTGEGGFAGGTLTKPAAVLQQTAALSRTWRGTMRLGESPFFGGVKGSICASLHPK